MSSLKFERLQLISAVEKTAVDVVLDRHQTMILGANSTGKSSLVKSLYWALGAEPARVHGTWTGLNVAALLAFSVDGVGFRVLRTAERFGVFDSQDRLLFSTNSVTASLGPWLAKHLDFELRLTTHQGRTQIATPAFCFLPFYIDQDEGWQQPWSSFDRLGQFKAWKQDTVDYHSGAKPKEYYQLVGRKVELDNEVSRLKGERYALERAFERVRTSQSNVPPPINRNTFKEEISRLIDEMSVLQDQRAAITAKLSVVENRRALLGQQIAIAEGALGELDRDYKFADEDDGLYVRCPTCGTDHHNSFANRFSISDDVHQCRLFIQNLQGELGEVEQKGASLFRELEGGNFRIARIEGILQAKRGKWRLQDMIDAEGERKAFELITDELQRTKEEIIRLEAHLSETKDQLKRMLDPMRKLKINDYFAGQMHRFLHELNVHTLPLSDATKIKLTLHNTGSDQPRTVLAYYLSFLATMREFGSSPRCPIVIDTPHQQDQDEDNARRIIDCVVQAVPADAQLIMAAVSLHGGKHTGTEILMESPQQLLRKEQYEEVGVALAPYLDAMSVSGTESAPGA